MNTILNNMKTELQASEQKLINIAKSIPTTDITKKNDAMRKIAAVNHAYLLLASETKSKTQAPKRHRTTTAVINGVEHSVKNQKDAVRAVCEDLVKTQYKSIKANNAKFVSSVSGEHFASINKDDLKCENPVSIKSGKKEFYYDPYRISINNGMLFKKMLKTMNVPEGYVQMS